MSMTKMQVLVGSDLKRDDIFADITCGDEAWAEVSANYDTEQYTIEIMPPRHSKTYRFDVDEMLRAVEEAKRRLQRLRPRSD